MYEKAIVHLEKSLEINSALPVKISQVYLLLGIAYSSTGKNKEAIGAYKSALEKEPENEIARYNLGALYDKEGQFEDAEREFRTLIKTNPGCADAYNYLGYLYAEKGINLDEAVILIKKALSIEPDNGYFVDSLGWAYFKKGLYDEALLNLKKASLLTQNDPVIFDHLGDAYFMKGNYREAISSWEKSLEIDPHNEQIKKKIEEARKNLTN